MTTSCIFQTHFNKSAILSCCIVLLLAEALFACTSFCLQDDSNLVIAKNRDYHIDPGLVIVNKKNVAKRAIVLDPTDKPAYWVSKYGSVTFNGFGRELPEGGINEAGLVLETMWLSETKYPDRDNREAVIAWLQYQLDNHGTIKEVIQSNRTLRAAAGTLMSVHFLGCDRQGNVATFEFIDGKLVYHTGDTLPVTALTNDTYNNSLAYLKQHSGFGGTKQIPCGSWGSLDRFVCAADLIKKYQSQNDKSIIEYAFETLTSVSQGNITKWMIVYDLKKMEIHYKTLRYPNVKTIRLRDCDFDCRTPVQAISINTAQDGLLNPYLHHYETDLNRWLIFYSFKHTEWLKDIPDEALEILAQYPEAPTMYYLTDWEVAGPYMQKDKNCTELFDIPLGQELPGTEVPWRLMPMGQNQVYLDLSGALNGGEQRVAYLRTQIESTEETLTRLEIYSDDGVKAWLNGKLVHANNVMRGISPKPDMIEVTLKKGTNQLMLKVTQNIGPWGTIVRLGSINPSKSWPKE
jgi:penicillin V acylase-like amidase (Ntn superfamily)